jgi:hypothetical protein
MAGSVISPPDSANPTETVMGDLILQVRGSSHNGQVVRIRSGKCSIGSAPQCTLRLVAGNVQPVHCLILRGPRTTLVRRWAADTRLNGRAFTDAELAAGDRLSIGPIELEVIQTGPSLPTGLAQQRSPGARPSERPTEANTGIRTLERSPDHPRLGEVLSAQTQQRLNQRAQEIEAGQTELAAQRTALDEERRRWEADRNQAESADAEAHRAELQSQHAELQQERAGWEAERTEIQQRLNQRAQEIEAGQTELAAQRTVLEEDRRRWEADRNQAASADAEAHRAELQSQHAALQQERAGWEAERTEIQQRLDQRAQEIEAGQTELAAQRTALEEDRRRWEADRNQAASAEAEAHRAELQSQHAELQQERAGWEAERAEIQQRLDQRAQEIEAGQTELAAQRTALNEERRRWEAEHEDLERQLQERSERLDARESELETREQVLRQRREEWESEASAPQRRPDDAQEPEEGGEERRDPRMTPSVSEAPVSVTEVFRRLGALPELPEDDEAPPEEPQPVRREPVRSEVVRKPAQPAHHGDEDEESIDDYMAKLLARTRSATSTGRPAESRSRAAESRPETPRRGTQPVGEVPLEQPVPQPEHVRPRPGGARQREPVELAPRTVAPEKAIDLSAMRALANDSAFNAIERHQRRQTVSAARAKLMLGFVSLGAGGVMTWVWLDKGIQATLYGAVACYLVAGMWGLQYIGLAVRLLLRIMTSGARRRRNGLGHASVSTGRVPNRPAGESVQIPAEATGPSDESEKTPTAEEGSVEA